MTDPQTPATEAGRQMLAKEDKDVPYGGASVADILAIEAEARADCDTAYSDGFSAGATEGRADANRQNVAREMDLVQKMAAGYHEGRADALREAADAVRAIPNDEWCYCDADRRPGSDQLYVHGSAVLALLEPQP